MHMDHPTCWRPALVYPQAVSPIAGIRRNIKHRLQEIENPEIRRRRSAKQHKPTNQKNQRKHITNTNTVNFKPDIAHTLHTRTYIQALDPPNLSSENKRKPKGKQEANQPADTLQINHTEQGRTRPRLRMSRSLEDGRQEAPKSHRNIMESWNHIWKTDLE